MHLITNVIRSWLICLYEARFSSCSHGARLCLTTKVEADSLRGAKLLVGVAIEASFWQTVGYYRCKTTAAIVKTKPTVPLNAP